MRPVLFLSRPLEQSKRFAQQAAARFGEAVAPHFAPVLEITSRPLGPEPDPGTGLIFTSQNAVAVAANQWDLAGRIAYCVGDRTAQAAQRCGATVRLGPGDGAGLVDLIRSEPPGRGLIHLRGAEIRVDVAQELGRFDLSVEARVAYDQIERRLSDAERAPLSGLARVLLPCFSPRSATLLSRECDQASAQIALFFLSPAVKAAWAGPVPGRSFVAASATADAMLNEIATFLCAPHP